MEISVFPEGRVEFAGNRYPAAIGRGGVAVDKREGDGATPVGSWSLRRVFYRADRVAAPATDLSIRKIGKRDGWCDDPESPSYNRLVTLPFSARHEVMWRADGLYDVVVELGYNDDPPVAGKGSAIFLHVARPDFGPTEGCVALALEDLLAVLANCGAGSVLTVNAVDRGV